MRLIAAMVVCACAGPVAAADKDEDKAKEAAVAFLKSVKAKDLDKAVKLTGVPFAHKDGDGDVNVIKEAGDLKKWLQDRFDELGDNADKVPTEIEDLHKFDDIKGQIKEDDHRKKAEEVAGKGAFVATVSANGKQVILLIRMKDGKAAVVGIGR